jgi:hypothetical protein
MALESWEKLIATGIEKNAVLDVRAATKTTPAALPDWERLIRAGNEELIRRGELDPRDLGPNRSWLAKLFPDFSGAGDAARWTVVGLVALAAIVVIPRLIPR